MSLASEMLPKAKIQNFNIQALQPFVINDNLNGRTWKVYKQIKICINAFRCNQDLNVNRNSQNIDIHES